MTVKSIASRHVSGWLDIFLVSGHKVSVPDYLRIDHIGTRVNVPPTKRGRGTKITGIPSGTVYAVDQYPKEQTYFFPHDKEGQERELFTILEGPYRGKQAVATALKNGARFQPVRTTPSAYMVFTMKSEKDGDGHLYGTLTFGSTTVTAFTFNQNAVPKGEYPIELPDFFHDKGRAYIGMCECPMTWFRVGNSGDRYIHPGERSDGCITIPPGEWNQVYRYLITARKGDNINVGMVKVINPFEIS